MTSLKINSQSAVTPSEWLSKLLRQAKVPVGNLVSTFTAKKDTDCPMSQSFDTFPSRKVVTLWEHITLADLYVGFSRFVSICLHLSTSWKVKLKHKCSLPWVQHDTLWVVSCLGWHETFRVYIAEFQVNGILAFLSQLPFWCTLHTYCHVPSLLALKSISAWGYVESLQRGLPALQMSPISSCKTALTTQEHYCWPLQLIH